MSAVVYHSNDHKKINGTLFYCFEYYVLLKRYIPGLQYILLNTSDEDLQWMKSIFIEKYNFDHAYLNDITNLTRLTDFVRLSVDNVLILDIHTYSRVKDFLGKARSVRVYSNEEHNYLNAKPHHVFYGFYDYQTFNKKTRIKLYADIHKRFPNKRNKVFVTSLNADNDYIVNQLGLDPSKVFVKNLNSHNENMYEQVGEMIYWHSSHTDTNNRAIVEAYIHDIPLTIHFNGHYHDSIYERSNTIANGGLQEMFLDQSDILIQDFINDCTNTK